MSTAVPFSSFMRRQAEMRRSFGITFAVGLAATAAYCQTATQGRFEVASIKPAVFPSDGYAAGFVEGAGTCGNVRPTISGNRVVWRRITLCGMIRFAYDMADYRIVETPDWMKKKDASVFYDVEARAEGEEPLSSERLRPMLRALLADRFQLKLHSGMRVLPIYALVVAKGGPKLAPGRDASPCNRAGRFGFSMCKGSVAQIAASLSRELDRPVMDRTGIAGQYSIDLKWSPDAVQDEPTAAPTIWTAVQEQLGLKLEAARDSVEVLVIDRAEKPSAN